jgi:hypothetical protein
LRQKEAQLSLSYEPLIRTRSSDLRVVVGCERKRLFLLLSLSETPYSVQERTYAHHNVVT